MTPPPRSAKAVTRARVRAGRAARDPSGAARVEAALVHHVDAALRAAGATDRTTADVRPGAGGPQVPDGPEVPARAEVQDGADGGHPVAPSVACYVSLRGEPGTGGLRGALRARGRSVLLPVLLPDLDLDWVHDPGRDGLGDDPLRPGGARLGPVAVASCDLVLVPALAVDRAGTRLGQGGGSYDRALARAVAARGPRPGGPLVLAVVHDDEVLEEELPREPHDVAVDGALTPSGVVLLR